MNDKMRIYSNPKLDFLFGLYGGEAIPPKHNQFKPIDVFEIDENGKEKILKDFYLRKPGKNAVREFQELIKQTAEKIFNETNRIKRPNQVEVVLSISLLEKKFREVDVDNLAKTVLDRLNKIAYDDDSQVSSLIVNKHIHPSKTNSIFIGITKLTEKRAGFAGDIKLFSSTKWE